MDLPDLNHCPFQPVPQRFWSTETDAPFRHCLECGTPLHEDGVPYLIEKAYRRAEPILEYALCVPCLFHFQNQLSAVSRSRMEAYLNQHCHLRERREQLMANAPNDVEAWLSHCIIKKRPIRPDEEYQIYAQCDGSDLIFSYHPYAVCGEAIEEMAALLSAETRGALDDFIGRHFGAPDGADLPRPVLV